MRIHLFLGHLGAGGAQRQFLQLAAAARERGHDVRLAVVEPGGHYWEEATGSGLATALWPERSRRRAVRAWRYLTAYRRLRRSVDAFDADVLYSALYAANVAARLAVRGRSGVPLVWGIRASDLPARGFRALWRRLGAHFSGEVDLAIANSEAGGRQHRALGFRPRAWATVPNGIDTDRFRPDPEGRREVRMEWGVGADRPLVGLVGRLDPMKGHEDFLAAAQAVRDARPATRFVCIGAPAGATRRWLENRTAEHDLAGAVRWVGEREDMRAVYAALDLLVLASRYGEGFPNVVAEAMACGTECVVTAVGDAAEIVGPLGTVVPPARPDRLAHAIHARLEDRAEREQGNGDRAGGAPGEAAVRRRRRIEERFSVDRCVDRTLELLAGVVAGRGAGAADDGAGASRAGPPSDGSVASGRRPAGGPSEPGQRPS